MKPFDYARATALVTGASSGIGEALARQLAERGTRRLILVARSKDKLDALAGELRTRHPGLDALVVAADLSDAHAPEHVNARTDERGWTVDLLVNNAGFGSYGFFDTRPPEREAEMVDLNVRAVVALTRLYLPGLIAQGGGGVLNVSSTAAFQPVPFMATYGATKAFVLSFSEALWAENRDRGVRVVCLCPGGTRTNFDAGLGVRGQFESLPMSTPGAVARAGLDALDRNASFVVVGRANYAGVLLTRLAPRSFIARTAGRIFRPPGAGDGQPSENKSAAPIPGTALGLLAGAALLLFVKSRQTD